MLAIRLAHANCRFSRRSSVGHGRFGAANVPRSRFLFFTAELRASASVRRVKTTVDGRRSIVTKRSSELRNATP